MPLAEKIAENLVVEHPDIDQAFALAHTAERDQYDTGRPFMPYLDMD